MIKREKRFLMRKFVGSRALLSGISKRTRFWKYALKRGTQSNEESVTLRFGPLTK